MGNNVISIKPYFYFLDTFNELQMMPSAFARTTVLLLEIPTTRSRNMTTFQRILLFCKTKKTNQKIYLGQRLSRRCRFHTLGPALCADSLVYTDGGSRPSVAYADGLSRPTGLLVGCPAHGLRREPVGVGFGRRHLEYFL
jgi:hypothetical protein